MDVLVVPSLWMETGPITVLEAWAAGIPVIGSNRGGIREWIDEFGGGRLFPPGDAKALASILESFCRGKISFQPMPEKSHIPLMKDVAELMTGVYRDLLAVKG
jgi:glycosyltransferase involved in cell wall biosynthesis